jgi:hypothetical protein
LLGRQAWQLVHASLNTTNAALSNSSFTEAVGGVVHHWAPHNSLSLYGCSIVIFIGATFWAVVARRKRPNPKKMTGVDLLRVGFAAGPIPIYLLLPLAPFDMDLFDVLAHEPFQMLIAAFIGLIWTWADIKKIIGRR